MTSKDKLIEFLKSANIEYIDRVGAFRELIVETYDLYYYFTLEGEYTDCALTH